MMVKSQSEFECINCGLKHTARAITGSARMTLETDGTVKMAFKCRDCQHTNWFDYTRE